MGEREGGKSWKFRIFPPGPSQVALVVKNPPAIAGDIRDMGSIPRLGRSPGEGNGNSLQYSCLGNFMGKEPGRLQSVRSQRDGHNRLTNNHELNRCCKVKWCEAGGTK